MRVFLIVLVVVGHSRYLNFVPYNLIEGTNPAYWQFPLNIADFLGAWIYSFHMPAFMALSGIVAYLTCEKHFDTFEGMFFNKFKRLMIPYFLCGLLWMIPLRIIALVYTRENLTDAIVNFLSLTGEDWHLWFLASLFFCFLMFYPLYKFIFVKTKSSMCVLVIAYLFYIAVTHVPFDFMQAKRAVRYLPYFILGFSFGQYRMKWNDYLMRPIVKITLCILFVLVTVSIKSRIGPPPLCM
jgi:fucose 4-O-acetylase-like acetyltransferase